MIRTYPCLSVCFPCAIRCERLWPSNCRARSSNSPRRLIERLKPTTANVKWVTPDQMHWTLKFLGEVDLVDVHGICRQRGRGRGAAGAVRRRRVGRGAFPDLVNPRTLWLGAARGPQHSSSCTRRSSAAWLRWAFGPSSADSGRTSRWAACARSRRRLARAGGADPRKCRVRCRHCRRSLKSTIFSSELGPKGPRLRTAGACGTEGREDDERRANNVQRGAKVESGTRDLHAGRHLRHKLAVSFRLARPGKLVARPAEWAKQPLAGTAKMRFPRQIAFCKVSIEILPGRR